MMLGILAAALLAAGLAPGLATAGAEEVTPRLEIENAWARPMAGGSDRGAGYGEFSNPGEVDLRVVGAESPRAERLEFHRTEINEGVMRMRILDGGLEIAAGETVTFEPGGLHLMFIGVEDPFSEGETVSVRLILEDGADIEIEFAIEAQGGGEMHHADDGHEAHDEHGHDH